MANDILLFADDTGANVLTQVAYAADTQRTLGNQAGIARSAFVNKVLRQTSFMSVALAQLIVDRTTQSVLDDGNDAVLLANLKSATDVAFNTNAATAKTTPIDADLLPIVDSAASNVLKKLSWLNLKATLKTYFDTLYSAVGSGSVSGVRQTVQSGSVDTSGFANFVSIGTGLNVNIAATTTPIKVHAAGGAISADRLGTISADKTLLLPASSTSYIYEAVATDGTCTSGSTTLAPIYQFGGTPAVTNGQFTYNISEGKGYLGNGTTAPQVWIAFHSEAITNGTNVTSVVTYALNGMYESPFQNLTSAALVNLNHNIGCFPKDQKMFAEFVSAVFNYSIGDTIELVLNDCEAGSTRGVACVCSINSAYIRANSSIYIKDIVNKTTGAESNLLFTSVKEKFIISRGW